MTTVLDRDMYTGAGTARLLRVAPATLHYWLEGGIRRNKTYKPVIREEATGSRTVTWADEPVWLADSALCVVGLGCADQAATGLALADAPGSEFARYILG